MKAKTKDNIKSFDIMFAIIAGFFMAIPTLIMVLMLHIKLFWLLYIFNFGLFVSLYYDRLKHR